MLRGFSIKTTTALLASLFWLTGGPVLAADGALSAPVTTRLPAFTFAAGEGASPQSLDMYRGKVVLLNFWATWCAPCIKEMPSLDALQAAYGPQGLVVLPVSRDATGMLTVKTWLKQRKFSHLKPFWDEGSHGAQALNVTGLPTSYLIGRDGDVAASVRGDIDWMGKDARAEVEKALAKSTPEEQATR